MSPKESSGGFRDEVKKFEADKRYDDRGDVQETYMETVLFWGPELWGFEVVI